MAWVEVTRDFDWRLEHHTTVAFLAGMRVPVTRAQLAAITAAGAGHEIAPPRRGEGGGHGDPEHGSAGRALGAGAAQPDIG